MPDRRPNAGRPLAVIVLAAGRGTRFPAVPSKVLVELDGRSLVLWVLDAVRPLAPDRILVVVGHGREHVEAVLDGSGAEPIEQREPRGTGHAVLAARAALADESYQLLVLNGDVPLLRTQSLERLREVACSDGVAAALLSAEVEDAGAYGRIIRGREGQVTAIVEAADASADQLEIREINVGSYAFRAPEVFDVLHRLDTDNAQGEIYLTDAVRALVSRDERVEAVVLDDPSEGLGINSPSELALLQARLDQRRSSSADKRE